MRLESIARRLLAPASALAAILLWGGLGNEMTLALPLLAVALVARATALYFLSGQAGGSWVARRLPMFALCAGAAFGEAGLATWLLGPDAVAGSALREGLSQLPGQVASALGIVSIVPGGLAAPQGEVVYATLWMGPARTHAFVLVYAILVVLVDGMVASRSWRAHWLPIVMAAVTWILSNALVAGLLLLSLPQEYDYHSVLMDLDHGWGPLVLALVVALSVCTRSRLQAPETGPRFGWASCLACAAAGLALVFASTEHLVPVPKAGRVLIEESHGSDWQPTLPAFDAAWTAADAPYNFASLAEYLGHRFEVRVNASTPIDELDLSRIDVLLLKIPAQAYSPAARRKISQFVSAGGGLLLLGDHTNLLKSGTYLNDVGREWGLRIRDDSLVGVGSNTQPVWTPPPWYSTQSGFFVERVHLLTAGSIDVRGRAFLPIRVPKSFSDRGRPQAFSHFGDLRLDRAEPTGPLGPIGLVEVGRGRVAAFADGTILTGFALHRDRHDEVALALISWLNARAESKPALRLGFGLAVLLLAICGMSGASGRQFVYLGAMVGVVFGLHAREWLQETPKPEATHAHERVAFLGSGGQYALPQTIGVSDVPSRFAMDTVFVTCGRVGLEPYWSPTLSDLRDGTRAVMLFNPAGEWPASHIHDLVGFARAGGTVVVFLCTDFHREPALGQLREAFSRASPGTAWHPLPLSAGLLSARSLRIGSGQVIETGDSCFYSREHLGHCFMPMSGNHGRLMGGLIELLRAAKGSDARPALRAIEAASGATR